MNERSEEILLQKFFIHNFFSNVSLKWVCANKVNFATICNKIKGGLGKTNPIFDKICVLLSFLSLLYNTSLTLNKHLSFAV